MSDEQSTKMFQICETDLSEIERVLPEWHAELAKLNSPRLRTQMRRIKDILSNVRWEYGPWSDVEVIPADE